MSTLKFLRALADELGTELDQLDDTITEYVLENYTDVETAACAYLTELKDKVNP